MKVHYFLAAATLIAASSSASDSTSYIARQVELRHIDYDVTVGQWDGRDVRIKVLGELPDRPAIQSRLDNGRLVVRSTDNYGAGTSVSVIAEGAGSRSTVSIGTGASNVVVQANGIHISAENSTPRPRIEISLPKNVDLELEQFSGEARIIQTPSRFQFRGSGSVQARRLSDSTIDAHGNAELQVEHVDGELNATLSDNAELQVDAGRISAIVIKGRDNAEASLDVTAETARLEARDNADIEVRRVKEKPTVQSRGNAEIAVGNWPSPDS